MKKTSKTKVQLEAENNLIQHHNDQLIRHNSNQAATIRALEALVELMKQKNSRSGHVAPNARRRASL